MVNAPRPKIMKELESFLGLVNFYARFLKGRATNMKPLYELSKGKKNKLGSRMRRVIQMGKR